MSAPAVTGKPPLPVGQPKPTDKITNAAPNREKYLERHPIQTSQQETISDGTILGLKDVFYSNEPDITYFCTPCQRFITLLSLKDHKSYHKALEILGADVDDKPTTVADLLILRKEKIQRLKEQIPTGQSVDIELLCKIDTAYERLKQDIEDTFESCRKISENIDPSVEGHDFDCGVEFVSAVSHCSNQNSRWKSTMEDCKVYQDYYGNDPRKAFMALYDGYSGQYAAAVAANELHYLLLNELAIFDSNVQCCCTFNMVEQNDISQYDLIRPPSPAVGNKSLIHKQSRNMIHQVIYTCEESVHTLDNHLSSHHPVRDKVVSQSPTEERKNSGRVKSAYTERMRAAFKRAYKLTDQVLEFGGNEKSRVRWSGCSALTIIAEDVTESNDNITSNTVRDEQGTPESLLNQPVEDKDGKAYDPPTIIGRLHIANAGNCHAVLVRDNRAYVLTKSHTYENSKERKRIQSLGGEFSSSDREMRVNGVLLTTRGLGNHGDPQLKSFVTWEPYCHTVAIDQYCQMLILATPGVWQVFSPEEAVELLLQLLPQNRISSPGYISPSIQELLKEEKSNEEESANQEQKKDQEPEPLDRQENDYVTAVNIASSPPALNPVTHTEDNIVDGGKDDDNKNLTSEITALSAGANNPQSQSKQERVQSTVAIEDDRQTAVDEDVLKEAEDELLPIDLRSLDSGNEADVDTDWASTVAPHDLSRLSAITSKVDPHRQLSRLLSERLVQGALLAGSKENITALVVLLPGIKL